jgi:hypothetical protein
MALIDTGIKVTGTRHPSPMAIVESHMAMPGESVAFELIGGVVVTNRGGREAGLFLRVDGAVVADVPIAIGAMPTSTADLIAKKVLTKTYVKSGGGLDLVRMCSCQYGPCGHCSAGSHHKCTTRVGFGGKPPAGPDTYLQNRRGLVVASVWRSGKGCRWMCPCSTCADTTTVPDKKMTVTAAPKRARGDLRVGEIIWLTPKTKTAPRICWQQPQAEILSIELGYVTVKIGAEEHRVHRDNIRRTDPETGKRTVAKVRRQEVTEGFIAETLF